MTISSRIQKAMAMCSMSQPVLAAETEISQPTLSRIITGVRPAKPAELAAIASATGLPLAFFLESDSLSQVFYAARSTNGAQMEELKEALSLIIETDRYLDDYLI